VFHGIETVTSSSGLGTLSECRYLPDRCQVRRHCGWYRHVTMHARVSGRHFDVARKVRTLRRDAENGNPFDVRVVASQRTACAEILDSKTQ
jgi:hypothetical protein